jgi:hypothetical protein
MPNLGGGAAVSRPATTAPRPSVALPSVSRPNVGTPNMTRPNLPNTRPSLPAINPSAPTNRPGGSGIAGGMKPSIPSPGNRPTTLPANRLPDRPNAGQINKPVGLPGTKPSFPNLGGGEGRPSTLPGNRPSTLPGTLPGNRPTTLPGTLPGNRPTTLPGTLPGNRPSTLPGTLPNTRPGTLPGTLPGVGDRPSPGDLGDFLGIHGGLKPSQRPALENRPTTLPGNLLPGNLPSIANRPSTLPGTVEPGGRPGVLPSRPIDLPTGIPGRPGSNNRPIQIGNINVGNTVINSRPSWVNIDNNRINSINNRWQTQIGGLHGWATTYPARIGYWNSWGNNVRVRWRGHANHNRWFAGDWWYSHPGGVCSWHYYHRFNNYPWNYWWRRPTWAVATRWFVWSAPTTVWSQPIYYDYGTGGNVTYQNNNVYVGGQQVATASEFAESAAALATVAPPASEEQAQAAEWLPLGTFALSTHESDVEPTRIVQLAVDQTGIVSGTFYNLETDQAYAIQGQVDKETQRVAFRLGESDTIVAETGIYNLTQDEAPLLVHFGSDRVENYVLVRLESTDESTSDSP